MLNLGARRRNNRGATKVSALKLASASRSFQSAVQRQWQSALAESPAYDQDQVYENADELTRLESPAQAFGPTSSSRIPSSTPLPDVSSNVSGLVGHESAAKEKVIPLYYRDSKFDKEPYWQKIGRWKDATQEEFLSHRWNVS